MEEIYQTLSHSVDLWKLPPPSKNETFDATEFWLHPASNKVNVDNVRVGPGDQERWLREHTRGSGDGAQYLVARFVWLVADRDKNEVNLSTNVQKVLLKAFGLRLAREYFKTFVTGVTALPPVSKPELEQRSYAFAYGPKVGAIWSHSQFKDPSIREGITQGLIFTSKMTKSKETTEDQETEQKPDTQKLLQKFQWNPLICRSPSFPAYLFSLLLSQEIDSKQAGILKKVQGVESATGFHEFESRRKILYGEVKLLELSARTSGYATKLASITRKHKMVERLLEFITKTVNENHCPEQHASGGKTINSGLGSHELLKANVDVLQQRLAMQAMDREYILTRVQIQLEAIFNLISQSDNMNNLVLSMATKEIAVTSQRDASSMKTLAVVTMFFLPGSFISALFSTNCFDWTGVDLTRRSDISVGPTPQFWLYWVITIPLTALTFLLYGLWLKYQLGQQQKIEQEENKLRENELHGQGMTISSEGKREGSEALWQQLARRRNTAIGVLHPGSPNGGKDPFSDV